ncbi:MAG: hypothetical protein HUK26_00670, partial [Duodenibacillus sp.]|nr:hypothetical protein [Duodenibacillus sp.]
AAALRAAGPAAGRTLFFAGFFAVWADCAFFTAAAPPASGAALRQMAMAEQAMAKNRWRNIERKSGVESE